MQVIIKTGAVKHKYNEKTKKKANYPTPSILFASSFSVS
jgi:hypothetical protein